MTPIISLNVLPAVEHFNCGSPGLTDRGPAGAAERQFDGFQMLYSDMFEFKFGQILDSFSRGMAA